ncbi:MAG: pilus assembly PilX N-terminal domain-containing protein [Candidatus Saccharimonadales bacterium]
MKTKKHSRSLKKNQSGIASMVIVILIMTLLTLVVLAMTQNANREQRQALDRQLSSQAFYAAESGVSDAKDFVANPPPGVLPGLQKKECEGVSGAEPGNQFPEKESQVGEFENTKYTCVLYDRTPDTLRYSSIDVGASTIVPIEDANASLDISSLTINWTKEDGGTVFSGCPGAGTDLPRQLANDCEAGLLRIELVDPSSTNRTQLINNTFLVYAKPTSSAGTSSPYASASGSVTRQGSVVSGGCNASGGCSLTIDAINKEKLYLNIRSLYKSNQVTVTGTNSSGGQIKFRDAQMEVDSTGQAGDILRRVQEMIDLSGLNSGFIPGFVLQTSSDVCKQLEVRPDKVDDNC